MSLGNNDAFCGICHARDVGLYYARHKELGAVLLCQQCWVKAYAGNELVSGSGARGCSCGS